MTRPSPRPRPRKSAELGVEKAAEAKQVTFSGLKFVRSEMPIGFEAATFCKTGVDLAPTFEQAEQPAPVSE